MPRNCQPGGQSGKLRVRYIPRRKLALVAAVRHVMEEEGLSQTKAAATLGVSQANISKWMKEHEHLLNAAKKPKKSSHPGPASQLSEIEDLLLRFIFEHREQGMAVTILMVVFKASALSDQFSVKTFEARYSVIRRFVAKHSLVYRMGTHESQRHPEEVQEEASDYMMVMRKRLSALTAIPISSSTWIRLRFISR